jgi:hypothetical protein
MSVHAVINNNLAKIVGLIAQRHPDAAIQIDWHERAMDERWWLVTATDGATEHVYIVDDELGHWAPANDEDLRTAGRYV